jgi:DNA replication protein DnaC
MLIQPLLDKLVCLKLSGMKEALSEQLASCQYNECSFEERLAFLVDHELVLREERCLKRRIKEAHFGQKAVIADVDMSATRGLDRSLVLSLAQGDWIRQHLNVIITGATGVGKTYLASALGYCGCEQGFSVRYFRTSRLLNDIVASYADGSWGKTLDGLARVRLLILDDWLRDRLNTDQVRNLLEIFDDRWQKGATILISQIPIGQWHERMGEPTLADAVLDRLVHNSHRIEMKGDSKRKQIAKEKKEKMNEK